MCKKGKGKRKCTLVSKKMKIWLVGDNLKINRGKKVNTADSNRELLTLDACSNLVGAPCKNLAKHVTENGQGKGL